jgi:hypothetical protein
MEAVCLFEPSVDHQDYAVAKCPEGPNLQHPDRPLMAHVNFQANTCKKFRSPYILWKPISLTARSKALFFGRSLAGIAGSNLAGDMDGFLL